MMLELESHLKENINGIISIKVHIKLVMENNGNPYRPTGSKRTASY